MDHSNGTNGQMFRDSNSGDYETIYLVKYDML